MGNLIDTINKNLNFNGTSPLIRYAPNSDGSYNLYYPDGSIRLFRDGDSKFVSGPTTMKNCNPATMGWFEDVIEVPDVTKKTKENKMFKSVKAYYEKYQDTILTVAIIFLLDHYMFDGKFKTKLEEIMEGFISKASNKIKSEA